MLAREIVAVFYSFKEAVAAEKEFERIFEKKKPEAVLHFAAETNIDRSVTEPNIFMETNIIGTIYLLELVKYFEVGRFSILHLMKNMVKLKKEKEMKTVL